MGKNDKRMCDEDSEFYVALNTIEKTTEERRYCKWSIEENKAYASFLAKNMEEFQEFGARRSKKFFTRMANQLQNGRDNEKCRSHHQKMIKKYKSIERIIE